MIHIDINIHQRMLRDALESYPDECCGFLFGSESGKERFLSDILVVNNAKEGDKRRRFEIAPKDYLAAERYAVEHDLTLLSVYHSHPNSPAVPSEQDRIAAQPYFSYVIVSIYGSERMSVRSGSEMNDFNLKKKKLPNTISYPEHLNTLNNMATVIIPTPLRKFAENQTKIQVNARTIEEAVKSIALDFPDLKKHLLDETGQLRSFLNIFVGDDDIRDLDQEKTTVQKDTVISIVPAIAGGIATTL